MLFGRKLDESCQLGQDHSGVGGPFCPVLFPCLGCHKGSEGCVKLGFSIPYKIPFIPCLLDQIKFHLQVTYTHSLFMQPLKLDFSTLSTTTPRL